MLLPLSWLLAFSLKTANASETSTLNSSVRALGMGDAFTAVADDHDSLFYNPAGLSQVRGFNWRVFDLGVGASDFSDYQTLEKIKGDDSTSYASDVQKLYGHHPSLSAHADSIVTGPMFGVGVYDHAGATVTVDNPVYPQVHEHIINDYGYVMGLGLPLTPFFNVGADLRYVKRTGTDTTYGPVALGSLNSSTITESITNWGTGYGADLGASFIIPAPLVTTTFAAAWKNVGGMKFTSPNGSDIPSEDNNITLGTALKFKIPGVTITPSIDVDYLNESSLQITRKLNFGIEIGLPIIDIRGGFHEGYYTAGLGMDLGFFRIDAATYGVELGDYPGQLEDRRYVIQISMDLGLGSFKAAPLTGDASSSSSDSGSKSSDSTSSSGYRLKQRR